jgi:hypothetical protein
MTYLNTVVFIYQGNNKPLKGVFNNKLEMFNEIIIMISFYHSFIFSDFVDDKMNQYDCGFVLIAVLLLHMIVHLINQIKIFASILRLVYIRYSRRLKRKFCCSDDVPKQ